MNEDEKIICKLALKHIMYKDLYYTSTVTRYIINNMEKFSQSVLKEFLNIIRYSNNSHLIDLKGDLERKLNIEELARQEKYEPVIKWKPSKKEI